MADFGLQVNYVHKRGGNYPAWTDIGGQYAQVPYVDNRGTGATGQTVNVYKLLTPSAQSVFLMTNASGPSGEPLFTTYNGVTLTGTKRMSHRWQGTFSLVVSKSEGRLPSSIAGPRSGQSATPASFGRFPNGPNDFVNTDGLLIAVSRPQDPGSSERLAAVVSGMTSLAAYSFRVALELDPQCMPAREGLAALNLPASPPQLADDKTRPARLP